jgi:hypothetical protein
VAEPAPGAGDPFRSIDELAALVGGYCWVEGRLFEMTGTWAGGGGGRPGITVCCHEQSSLHGDNAARWRERLPVRAGVDAAALVVAPPGWGAVLGALADQPEPYLAFSGLVDVALPRLRSGYRDHLAGAAAVREAPVIAVLRLAGAGLEHAIALGNASLATVSQAGLQGDGPDGELTRKRAEFGRDLQRLFEDGFRIFPAARAS